MRRPNYSDDPLTAKQQSLFELIDVNKYTIIANEDIMKCWYLKGKRKIPFAYGTYLHFWYKRLLQELTADIDTCIFTYSLIHH